MPFVDVKASCPITEEQEKSLKSSLADAVTKIPGKDESRLMLSFSGDQHMWYAGAQDGPTVMVQAAIYGHTSPEAVSAFGEAAVDAVRKTLNAQNVYFKLEQTTDWAF